MNLNEYDERKKIIDERGQPLEAITDKGLKMRIETDVRKAMRVNVWMYGVKIAIVTLICLGIGWGIVSLYL